MRGVVVLLIAILLSTSVSAFAIVEHWHTPRSATRFVSTSVNLDISDVRTEPGLKVAFTIPELGIRSVRGPYEPSSLRHASVHRTLEIPYDAEPGEYVIRMYVTDKNGNKRIRHRFIEVV